MILKFTNSDRWNLGKLIAVHLVDVDDSGKVTRLIDLGHDGCIIDIAPTDANPHGAIDHAPLDMRCDWSRNGFPSEEFESLWRGAIK